MLIGTDVARRSASWSGVAQAHALTAIAIDDGSASTTSAAVHDDHPESSHLNVALAASGGVATASSTYSPKYPAAGAISGDRRGYWGNGGGWNDGAPCLARLDRGAFPRAHD